MSSPVFVSEAEIKIQLEKLGYKNVPENIVHEFVEDLRRQAAELAHNHKFSPGSRASPQAVPVQREEFVTDVEKENESVAVKGKTHRQFNQTHDTPEQQSSRRTGLRQQGNAPQNRPATASARMRQARREQTFRVRDDASYESSDNENEVTWRDLGGPGRRHQSMASRTAARRGFLRTSMSGQQKRPGFRKADPVSRGKQARESWSKDSFLAHGSSKRPPSMKFKATDKDFYKKKRGPTMKVNKYVIPTSKRRDDVRWATRARMLDVNVAEAAERDRTSYIDSGYFSDELY